ncbi:MAG: MFS transporter [Marinospirillum sp.]|uniref:MFS transporter n=1 Tax=Marinospirillum sp. TaxID=2183934 RepID=UPI001A0AB0A2|nr:MFS transporter [Marinospirillum sp.]MBE0505136.1 MFS transporter [Marinospirillum sp.]
MPKASESHFLLNSNILRPAGFLALVFLMSLSLVTATTLATTLFLSQAGASALPLFFILFALVSTPVSALVSWWADRIPRLFILATLWALLGGLALIAWWLGIQSSNAAFVFYLGISTTELLLGSLAGILLSDYFSLTQSKRMTGKLSLMLALGGVCGALLVSLSAIWLSPNESLWLIALISLLGLILVYFYHQWQKPLAESMPEETDDHYLTSEQQGKLQLLLAIFKKHSLARWLTAGVFFAVVIQCLQEILAFTLYEQHYVDEQSLAVFLGFAVGLLHLSSLMFALLITGLLLPRIGVSRTHLFHPLFNLFAFAAVALSGRLWSGVIAHIASDPLDVSVNSPTTTLLYNALPTGQIGSLRLFNDGIVYPVALGLSGVLLLFIEPLLSLLHLAILGGLLSIALLLMHWRAGQSYEQDLKKQVSVGTLQLGSSHTNKIQPRARGLHSYTAAAEHAAVSHLEKVSTEDIKLTTGMMNQWLTQLHQPSLVQQLLPYIHALDDRELRKALMYMLPKMSQHPLDSLVLFIRGLPPLNERIAVLLLLWFRKHWGNPLTLLYMGYSLTSKIRDPLKRRLIHLVTENYRRRAQCLLLELLRPYDTKGTLQGIEIRLYAGDSRQKAQALETLSLIPQRHLTYWLNLVFEPLPSMNLRTLLKPFRRIDQDMVNLLKQIPDPWMNKMAEVYPRLCHSESCTQYVGASLMERLELLHQVPLFAELNLDDLQSLDAQLRSRKVNTDELLFNEGDPGDCLYILVSGELAVSRKNDKGENMLLAKLGAGQPVGEMALLDELPRSATAVATCDSEILRLDKLRFHSLVMQRPQILLGMCKVLATRLRG